jgi:RNA polymerase sigma-70 factor (ECF subfamily)
MPAVFMSENTRIENRDKELIRRMALKESTALDEFYERYNRIAFSLVFRIVGRREDTEDVLVDVFWQVWQQAARYDASRGKPVAWLLTIARTRAIDYLRSGNRQPIAREEIEQRHETSSAGAEPDPFVLADMRQAVLGALETLSENQRVPLEMAYFQGMSHTEIAAATNLPLGTIKDRIRTGMMHLRKRLKAYL